MQNAINKTPLKFRPALLVLAVAAAMGSAAAQVVNTGIVNRITNMQSSGSFLTTNTGYRHYVDWSAKSSVTGHLNYSTMTSHASEARYLNYTNFTNGAPGTPGRCFRILTSAVDGVNADTQILIKNASGIWVSLADDVTGNFAAANIFFHQGSNTRTNPKIRVAAYNSGSNNDMFRMESVYFTDNLNACLEGNPELPGTLTPAAATVDAAGNVTIHRAL